MYMDKMHDIRLQSTYHRISSYSLDNRGLVSSPSVCTEVAGLLTPPPPAD